MNYTFLLFIFCLIIINDKILAEIKLSEIDPKKYPNNTDIGNKDTLRSERDLLLCSPGIAPTVQLLKLEIVSEDSIYSRLCDHNRTLTDFRITVNITLKTKRQAVTTILNVIEFNENRNNGSVKVNGIGFVEEGIEQLRGTSFFVEYDVPNVNPSACWSVEGLTKQTGVGVIIFSKIDVRRLNSLYTKYNPDQLVPIFKNYSVADCIGTTVLSYSPGLLHEKVIEQYYPISTIEKRETTETIEQTLEECELLSAKVVRIEETSVYSTYDSCDAIDVFDRYENDLSVFDVYVDPITPGNRTEAKIIFSNGFRNKGSFFGIAIGIIIKGVPALIGSTYLEMLDIPNTNPYGCQTEPGITHLVGSSEKIIANLDVQNLLSVMDLESIIVKIRSNRVVDCMGGVTVTYTPGLLFSDALIQKREEEMISKVPRIPFKFNKIKKIFIDKLGPFGNNEI